MSGCPDGHCRSKVSAPNGHRHYAVLFILTVTLKCSMPLMVTVTPQCSVFIMLTVTLKCSVLLKVTVTPQCSVLFILTVTLKCSVLFMHTVTDPYRHSAVVMNVPGPRTASRQTDAAASHSCHFNTVLYPRFISECQLPPNCSRRDIPAAAFSVQNYHKSFSVTALSSLAPLQTCQHLYITLYNVPP